MAGYWVDGLYDMSDSGRRFLLWDGADLLSSFVSLCRISCPVSSRKLIVCNHSLFPAGSLLVVPVSYILHTQRSRNPWIFHLSRSARPGFVNARIRSKMRHQRTPLICVPSEYCEIETSFCRQHQYDSFIRSITLLTGEMDYY